MEVLDITFSRCIFERVEINSSVMPSAKYSSFGSGLMFTKGRIATRSLLAEGSPAPFFATSSFCLGPLSHRLIPRPSSTGFNKATFKIILLALTVWVRSWVYPEVVGTRRPLLGKPGLRGRYVC